MKITMFGATGPTGKHFTALALKNGHQVTALVRDASKLSAADKLSIVVGDVRRTGLEPQPSRLKIDLPLTRASPALDRRQTRRRSSALSTAQMWW